MGQQFSLDRISNCFFRYSGKKITEKQTHESERIYVDKIKLNIIYVKKNINNDE